MSTDSSYEDAAFEAEMAVVEALADKAMADWNAMLSPADRIRVRDLLVEALATHPNVSGLIAQLATSPTVEKSGEVGDPSGAASEFAKAESDGSGKK